MSVQWATNFALFLCSLVFAMFWVTYITFFNSQLVGSVTTHLANKFLPKIVSCSYVKIGSLSFSVLAGKIMFRDFIFISPDMSLRVQDGYIIFRWWRSYVPKVSFISCHVTNRFLKTLSSRKLEVIFHFDISESSSCSC